MTRKRTFLAAKVNIHGNIFSSNLDELITVHIPRVILESQPIKRSSWTWAFTDRKSIEVDGLTLIVGHLTKSKQQRLTIRVGLDTMDTLSEHELANRAFFVYDPKSEVLVHEANSSISGDTFIDVFTDILSRDHVIGEVVIKPFVEPKKIRDELHSIQKITSLHFHFIQPNPGNRRAFNAYQEILQGQKAKELEVKTTNKDGLNVIDPENPNEFIPTVESGIMLVEEGYGDINAKGYNETKRQGKRKTITEKKTKSFSSRKWVRSIRVTPTEDLMQRIMSFMHDIVRRS